MPFNSLSYIILYLFVAVVIYWLLPQRFRVYFIIVASLSFYATWRWEFCFLVLFSALASFIAGGQIAGCSNKRTRRRWLIGSLIINLGLLALFKYTYFIGASLSGILSLMGVNIARSDLSVLKLILPLGISFYTFHMVSYIVDVYRGVVTPPKGFSLYLAYVIFWPQLIAGPILRFNEVAPQLKKPKNFHAPMFIDGVTRILNGLFKKVVLADSLAPMVEFWFDQPHSDMTGFDAWVAAFLFGFQIYFDFSGYSDIAIGSAKLLGINFPENFNWPYLARSPKEFWKMWHISLSSWIRDYLYLPLAGRKFQTRSEGGMAVATEGNENTWKHDGALILTWAIMGLWHGAAWTLVVWGLYHGTIILLYRLIPALKVAASRWPHASWLLMLTIAMVGWIPFRSHDLSQTWLIFSRMINPLAYTISPALLSLSSRTAAFSYLAAAFFTVSIPIAYWLMERTPTVLKKMPVYLVYRTVAVTVIVFFIVLSLQTKHQFIYFQF
jgi:alginate O-acetyltransferase complex protein AlgI